MRSLHRKEGREGAKERGRGKGKERESKEDISSYASDLCHV